MGEVFLARHVTTDGFENEVVVKRILPHLVENPDFVDYFLHEGRLGSILSHPNIVKTLEVGRAINNELFIVQEYVPGVSLVQLLATAMKFDQYLSLPLVTKIALQIARALNYVHTKKDIEGQPLNIIHMDLAPHNILVSQQGDAKLLDFGIARTSYLKRVQKRFRGRTAYLAPEQLDGLDLDQRVDIFALGIVLHEVIACRPLFRSQSDRQTASRILYAPVPDLCAIYPQCPADLNRAIQRCLIRNRDERFQSCAELVEVLEQCAAAYARIPSSQIAEEVLRLIGESDPAQKSISTSQKDLQHEMFDLSTVSII